jgi:hypothetical protein
MDSAEEVERTRQSTVNWVGEGDVLACINIQLYVIVCAKRESVAPAIVFAYIPVQVKGDQLR